MRDYNVITSSPKTPIIGTCLRRNFRLGKFSLKARYEVARIINISNILIRKSVI